MYLEIFRQFKVVLQYSVTKYMYSIFKNSFERNKLKPIPRDVECVCIYEMFLVIQTVHSSRHTGHKTVNVRRYTYLKQRQQNVEKKIEKDELFNSHCL